MAAVGTLWSYAVLGCLLFVSSFAFASFFGGSVFCEEFVLVLPEVCCVDDLIKVFSGLLALFVRIHVRPCMPEVVGSSVSGVNHEGRSE